MVPRIVPRAERVEMAPEFPSAFEGSEKKAEILLAPGAPSLLDLPPDLWKSVCAAAGTEILSSIRNDRSVAYLLAESSLFVAERSLIMLTCGRTTLHRGVVELLSHVHPDSIEMFVYQRKNETYPRRQPTSFAEDLEVLSPHLPGRAYRFGHEEEHHLYLYHLDRERDRPADTTIEILMYGMAEATRRCFNRAVCATPEDVRERTGLDRLLPGFDVDDHLFDPSGYSLNALRDDSYYTVHVTPEATGSYASFETNHPIGDLARFVDDVLGLFCPRAFDVVVFDRGESRLPAPAGYYPTAAVRERLDLGYTVRFSSFLRPPAGVDPAFEFVSKERSSG